MSDQSACENLGDEIDRVIDYFREEFDITYAEVIGTLHLKAWLLCQETDDLHTPE